jgi:hypothetical protein
MIIYRTTSGREVLATRLRRAEGGGTLVEHEDGSQRWIPDNWIIEED